MVPVEYCGFFNKVGRGRMQEKAGYILSQHLSKKKDVGSYVYWAVGTENRFTGERRI